MIVVLLMVVATRITVSDRDHPGGGPDRNPKGDPIGAPVALDAGGFVDGGCVALSPTSGDRRRTVLLDAGHGAPDPGASGMTAAGQRVLEKDLTLAVARTSAQQLRGLGFRVVLSRAVDRVGLRLAPQDVGPGGLSEAGNRAQLAARARCANIAGADALVSIHLNSFADPEVGGAETLYEPDRSFGVANQQLASVVQQNVVAGFAELGHPVTDRGIVGGPSGEGEQGRAGDDDLVILGPARPAQTGEPNEPSTAGGTGTDAGASAMPGALLEALFLTNPREATLVATEVGRYTLAAAITRGLDTFLPPV